MARVGNFELNIETGHLTWSDQMYRLFGFEVNEVNPTFELMKQMVHSDDLGKWIETNEPMINEHRSCESEFRIVRKDGKERVVDSKADLRFDNSGKLIRVVGTAQDITISKRAAEGLKEAREQLEKRVQERTNELAEANAALRTEITERKRTEEQLVQAAKLASLGQLGAGIAHELNQPITTIQGFAQRIKRDGTRQVADHADELDLIINASHRMARIVDNIRTFSRQSDFKAQPINPITPLDDALMLISEQLRLHSIEVERPAGDAVLPLVMGDRIKLQQVFSNLIMNTRDALGSLPKGRPRRLVLGLRVEGDRVVYSVEDNGPGISKEDQARIFDPFYTTKEVGQGTGLGLSISHGIVTDHGGEIRYEPVEGGGARFLVSLLIASYGGNEDRTGS